jgi:SAM-dependent methyltransferase
VSLRVISELSASHEGFDVTDRPTLEALRRAEDEHFWHRTRNEWIARRLALLGVRAPDRILELGCGGGCVAAHLASLGYAVTGVDGQRALLELASTRAPRATFWLHDLRRGTQELPEKGFDVVGLFDVLEHLDEPGEALEQAAAMARPLGLVVGTVPAMQGLYSQVDAQAGHRLRYEREQLLELVGGVAKTRVIEVVGFNRVLVPMLWVQRKLVVVKGDRSATSRANLSVPPRPLNQLLASALRLERALGELPVGRLTTGSSLWFALRVRS